MRFASQSGHWPQLGLLPECRSEVIVDRETHSAASTTAAARSASSPGAGMT
jgi:hypothetical protein